MLCSHRRKQIIHDYIKERTAFLGTEYVANILLKEFTKIDIIRERLKSEIHAQKKWIQDFSKFALTDSSPKTD